MKPSSPQSQTRLLAIGGLAIVAIMIFGGLLARDSMKSLLFGLTGEEKLLPQIKALSDLAADALRPPLHLAPDAPVRYAGVNPFGINVFLNEEVDPAKREQTVRLAAEAGYHWLRQEFPWEDIEIHGKGDFVDRRNDPPRSSWDKYDEIVDLAERYHMELIVRISTPPSWTRAAGSAVGSFAPPDNYDDFGDFVSTLVGRYRGRVRFFQIWNEPNIYPEWGNYAISPEQYTALLKIGATRARQADPNVVIISGALASTIALDAGAQPPQNALNDLLFLQRMYDAGAAPYFDIMAMQAYGLWSGPSDRRMQPRVINFGRPQFVRDLMVANGDAGKPIWISEMAWSAVPDEIPDKRFGQVTPEQQSQYTVAAYERAITEWPWMGVANTWYFKRASDQWFQERKPEAYFRLADPDFNLQPVYFGMKQFTSSYAPVLYPGTHSPDAWAIHASGRWAQVPAPSAAFQHIWVAQESEARLTFSFRGTGLRISAGCLETAECGRLLATVDNLAPVAINPAPATPRDGAIVPVAGGLSLGVHSAVVTVAQASSGAPAGLTALIVQ